MENSLVVFSGFTRLILRGKEKTKTPEFKIPPHFLWSEQLVALFQSPFQNTEFHNCFTCYYGAMRYVTL